MFSIELDSMWTYFPTYQGSNIVHCFTDNFRKFTQINHLNDKECVEPQTQHILHFLKHI